MSPLVAGGKARKEKPAPRPVAPLIKEEWGDVNVDPFPVDQDTPSAERASYLADAGIWQAQMIGELAPLARKYTRLARKLETVPDNPHRPDAIKKARSMHHDMVRRVRDLVMAEAQADRVWQSLTPEERQSTHADGHWMTPATEPRLIGRTWVALATFEQWPAGFRLQRQWFSGIPLVIVMDLRTFKVYAWQPNPPADSIWTDHRNDTVPEEIRKDALRGNKS